MKKIVAVAALASLLAGATFAADLSFDYTGKGIFGNTTKAVNSVVRNDCFALELKSDVAGVHIDWDISDSDDSTKTEDKDAEKLGLDEFYGWMTFGLPVGNLQVTSGKWKGRYADRVTTDKGDLGSDYFETYKLGNIIDKTASNDADNLTEGAMSTVLAYTLADSLPGTLMTKFGLVNQGNYFNGTVSKPDTDIRCGFVGQAAYKQEGLINLDLSIKHLKANITTLGFYVSPLMAEALQATAGFTYGYNTSSTTEIAFDLRARYAVTEKVALTGFFNYSQVKIKDVDDPTKSMWTSLTLNYVAGENIRFLATLGNTITDFDKSYGACKTHFTPACEIKASEKVTVTTAVDLTWDNSGATGVKPFAGTGDITIPVYVHVAL